MAPLTPKAASDLFRAEPHRLIDVGAGAIAHRQVGEGPDVLFVHGWPVSGATFRGLLPHLAPHMTCHVIDLVGAGQSQFDRSTPINLAQHIKSIRRVVDELELKSVAVVGHDSGGLMARHALGMDPRTRAFGLVNTEQSQGLNWRFKQLLMMAKIPGFEALFASLIMKPNLRRNGFILGDCFHDRALLSGEFEAFFLEPLASDPERLWAAGQLGRAFDVELIHQLTEVHGNIKVPVKLVWGEDDPFFPVDWAREMVDAFPNASIEVIPNAKLFVHEERPEAVAKALLPTLLGSRS